MSAITLNHTKGEIKRAGECLSSKIDTTSELDRYFEAFSVLDNWRISHEYPMQSMLGYFRNKAFDVDPRAIVARRLKRTPSIVSKLEREQGMRLDRMEDIGGVRIIVATLDKVESVVTAIKSGRTRNILRRERDYIKTPKKSGYRGHHLIYRYNGQKTDSFPFHNVELQVRTLIQHSWATTVEVVGTFTRQGLKASKGSKVWLDFFELAGKVLSTFEKGSPLELDCEEIDSLIEQIQSLEVLGKLQAYAVTTKYMNEKPRQGDRYFMMTLNADSGGIQVTRFPNLDIATSVYGEREQELRESQNEDVVLVSTESIRSLKLAYPNYFADTTNFRQYLRIVMARRSQQLRVE